MDFLHVSPHPSLDQKQSFPLIKSSVQQDYVLELYLFPIYSKDWYSLFYQNIAKISAFDKS